MIQYQILCQYLFYYDYYDYSSKLHASWAMLEGGILFVLVIVKRNLRFVIFVIFVILVSFVPFVMIRHIDLWVCVVMDFFALVRLLRRWRRVLTWLRWRKDDLVFKDDLGVHVILEPNMDNGVFHDPLALKDVVPGRVQMVGQTNQCMTTPFLFEADDPLVHASFAKSAGLLAQDRVVGLAAGFGRVKHVVQRGTQRAVAGVAMIEHDMVFCVVKVIFDRPEKLTRSKNRSALDAKRDMCVACLYIYIYLLFVIVGLVLLVARHFKRQNVKADVELLTCVLDEEFGA